MRRLGLIAITTLALVSGPSLTAWADTPTGTTVVSSSADGDPTTPGLVGADGSDLVSGAPEAAETTATGEDRTAARAALAEVKELFAPKSRAAAQTQAASGADPTMALRDLSLRLNALGRAPAGSDLASFQRPWDDGAAGATSQCTANLCLHWATSYAATGNGADITNTTWAQGTVLPVLAQISATYRSAGYRTPIGDNGYVTNPYSSAYGQPTQWGGTTQTDIYLKDLGGTGVYGYCAYDLGDDGRLVYYPVRGSGAVPVFCVLDNDFSTSQYRPTYAGESSADMLRVTAAHEYFHAVQFAYDAFEDGWFMEATATWAERQVYPAIPDNRQYLPYSQIRFPAVSLDTWAGNRGLLQYADWIFFQYLSHRVTARTGALPNVVLQMWQFADSLGRDQYSTQAIASTLAARKLSFATVFGQYAAANRRAAQTYLGGAAYPAAAAARTYGLRKSAVRRGTVRVNHLASVTLRFKPKKVTKASHKAKISVNMATKSQGSVAAVTIVRKNGTAVVKLIKLNKKGDGAIRVPFSTKKVAYLELTLVNANRSYTSCSADSRSFSCGGVPVHDRVKEKWSIKA